MSWPVKSDHLIQCLHPQVMVTRQRCLHCWRIKIMAMLFVSTLNTGCFQSKQTGGGGLSGVISHEVKTQMILFCILSITLCLCSHKMIKSEHIINKWTSQMLYDNKLVKVGATKSATIRKSVAKTGILFIARFIALFSWAFSFPFGCNRLHHKVQYDIASFYQNKE